MTKKELLKLLDQCSDLDEIYTITHSGKLDLAKAHIAYCCYKTNGAVDLLEPEDFAKIKEDAEYCDKTYLNINASELTLVVY